MDRNYTLYSKSFNRLKANNGVIDVVFKNGIVKNYYAYKR